MSHHSQSIRTAASLLVIAVIAASCSKKDSGGPTGVSPAPPPPPTWTSLIGRALTVAPGATGTYLCTQFQVPSDLYIKGFRTKAVAALRMLLTVSDHVPTANVPSTVGDFPCSAGVRADRVLYASAAGTPDFVFPAGVGVHVRAGQYLLLTILGYDPNAAAAFDTVEISVEKGAAADVMHDSDILMAGARQFVVAKDTALVQGGCSEPLDFQVFASAPMMNLLGIGQVDLLANGHGDTIFVDTAYSALHQAYTLRTSPLAVNHNDQIIINCEYDNTTGHVVAYGEDTDSEVCYDAMYRYPASDSANSFGCIS